MNYSQVIYNDMVNGVGIGTCLFVSGCEFNCKGCFNKKAQNFNNGKEFDAEEFLLTIPKTDDRLSILGGEPLHPFNLSTVLYLCSRYKQNRPDNKIWLWTGYKLDTLPARVKELLLNHVDYIIDGQYESEKPTHKPFRGSDNQILYKNDCHRQFIEVE